MVTFIIGNGFDLRVGLNTRYTDFYKVYTQPNNNDPKIIKRFKEEILKDDFKNWADFELKMGEYSNQFIGNSSANDFLICFDDFVTSFRTYLEDETENIDWSAVDDVQGSEFKTSITHFFDYMKRAEKNEVLNDIPIIRTSVNFLQFNYTDTFDKMLAHSGLKTYLAKYSHHANRLILSVGKNLHVHGDLKNGHITMGVDSAQQISNTIVRNDSEVTRIFIKPNFLENLQARDRRNTIARNNAIQLIKQSSIICAYGASIGDTDKFWWKQVGEWLTKGQRRFIIFNTAGATDDRYSPLAFSNNEVRAEARKHEIESRFLRLAELGEDWPQNNPGKFFVELDTNMFDFELPRKKEASVSISAN